MVFYLCFAGHGRKALADTLELADPFGMQPAAIVDRVLALGHVADVTKPRYDLWPTVGRVFKVRRNEQDFLIAVSWEMQEISVQELRADRYDPVE